MESFLFEFFVICFTIFAKVDIFTDHNTDTYIAYSCYGNYADGYVSNRCYDSDYI